MLYNAANKKSSGVLKTFLFFKYKYSAKEHSQLCAWCTQLHKLTKKAQLTKKKPEQYAFAPVQQVENLTGTL